MIKAIITTMLLIICVTANAASAKAKSDYRKKLADVDKNSAKELVDLALWCKKKLLGREFRENINAAIKIDPDNKIAHKALGEEKINGKWLSGDELKIAQGYTKRKGKWISKEDAEKIAKGFVYSKKKKKWISPDEYYKEKGFVKYNGKWVSKSTKKKIEKRKKLFVKNAEIRSDWKKAKIIKTKHFVIKSNCPQQVIIECATALEQCYSKLKGIFGAKEVKGIPIDIFATRDQFERIGNGRGSLGYFWYQGSKSGIRTYYVGNINMTIGVLFHECTHLIFNKTVNGKIPTWMNEGMAVLMEDAEKGEKSININAIPFSRLWNLKDQLKSGKVSLTRLLSRDGARQYSVEYYPQGWGLIYFLFTANGNKYRKYANAMFSLLKSKGMGAFDDNEDFFKKVMKKNPDDLFEEWKEFIMEIEPSKEIEYATAITVSTNRSANFKAAHKYEDEADNKFPKPEHSLLLAKASLYLRKALYHIGKEEQITFAQKSVGYFKKYEATKEGILKKKKKTSMLLKTLRHSDFAKAYILANEYELATEKIENIFEIDFMSSSAYRALALLQIMAEDNNCQNLTAAEENIDLVKKLGDDAENYWLEALLTAAKDRQESNEKELSSGARNKISKLLSDASNKDRYGFGRSFYRHEINRFSSTSSLKANGRTIILPPDIKIPGN